MKISFNTDKSVALFSAEPALTTHICVELEENETAILTHGKQVFISTVRDGKLTMENKDG